MTNARRDLMVIIGLAVAVLGLSYFFNVFNFLVQLLEEDPRALASIDEVISVLLIISISFAVFSWRRWVELKKETAKRLALQEELLKNAETRAETERIISKQLRCEIEERKRISERQSQR